MKTKMVVISINAFIAGGLSEYLLRVNHHDIFAWVLFIINLIAVIGQILNTK